MFAMDLPEECDIVLGMNFLKKHNVIADFAHMKLSVRDYERKREIIAVGQARPAGTDTNDIERNTNMAAIFGMNPYCDSLKKDTNGKIRRPTCTLR